MPLLKFSYGCQVSFAPVADFCWGPLPCWEQAQVTNRRKTSVRPNTVSIDNHMISRIAIWDKSARVHFSKTKKIARAVGRVQFAKFTSADLSQIARENHVITC